MFRINLCGKEELPMQEALFGVVVTIAAQIVFYFVQKALDNWWDSHFPPSNGHTAL